MEKYEGKSGVVLMHTHFVDALSDVGAGREEAKKNYRTKCSSTHLIFVSNLMKIKQWREAMRSERRKTAVPVDVDSCLVIKFYCFV